MKIVVLMSTYNGEKFLREQIDSLLAQTYPVEIYVRDDGSTDSTQSILDEYRKNKCLEWYTGENLKPAKSFWNLVQTAPQADYYAFCDQDDVWFPDKIERAIKRLMQEEDQNQPLLYCSNVTVTDADLKPASKGPDGKVDKVNTDFAHSLIYSLAPGCTMVFNAPARTEMIKYDMNKEFEIIHDWLTHKITAMLGTVIYDSKPSMLYRQHGNNVIGAQNGGIRTLISGVKRLMTTSAGIRSGNAQSILNIYEKQLNTKNIELLYMVANYKKNKKQKKALLHNPAFKVRKKTDFLFRVLVRMNKI